MVIIVIRRQKIEYSFRINNAIIVKAIEVVGIFVLVAVVIVNEIVSVVALGI